MLFCVGVGGRVFERLVKSLVSDFLVSLLGFLEVGLVGVEGICYFGRRIGF